MVNVLDFTVKNRLKWGWKHKVFPVTLITLLMKGAKSQWGVQTHYRAKYLFLTFKEP
jgi:hypothetical protein